jgi:phosphomannomutase/phosphoglucomutase
MGEIFKPYDVRGIYPSEINEEVAYLIGRAFATVFPEKTIAVGWDVRLSTPSLKESLIKGLLESGSKVVDIGMVPTPVVYFACYKIGCDYGIMITGSHLTKEFNGMKFCDKTGIPISYEAGLNKIKELVKTKKFREGKGKLTKTNIDKKYIEFMKSLTPTKFDGIKIVIDGSNGSAGKIYSELMKECGAEVTEIYCEPDGNFPNHTPDPMKKEFIIDLENKVKEMKSDLGFAFDSDGDRLNIVDESGNVTNSNHIFSLIIEDALKNNKGAKVVHEVLCSKLVDDVIEKNGGIPITWRVGHTFIANKCQEENAILAGEVSGHYFFKETNYTDDVLVACLKILKILKQSKKSLSELTRKYPKYYQYAQRIPVKEEKKFDFIEELKEKLKSQGYNLTTFDGVRVNFDHGWMLFRPANTESKISMGLESSDKEEFEKIKKIADEIIKTIPQ